MPPRRSRQLALAIPVITLILAFTAIPAELRPPQMTWSGFLNATPQPYDLVANVIGYVPLGAVLATHGWPAAAGIAAATSAVAEASQLFARGRETSLIDLATNVAGALAGWTLARRWRILSPSLRLTPLAATMAAALAVACFVVVARVTPREFEDVVTTASKTLTVLTLSANERGTGSADGRLEARWSFDVTSASTPQDAAAGIVHDASSNGVDGVFRNGPTLVPGIVGRGLQLDGTNQHVTFETPVALRLKGSMTITAWINSSRFPESDAAIVSSYGGFGYQLDTTVDQGPRTIAFRVTNAWGQLTSRYGATPLETNTWYHVAGVFDARSRTLDVFLDGEPDNGCLAGTVTGRQTISPDPVYIGRPPRDEGFAFAGIVDEVRIYSRALSPNEIQKEMREASRPPAAPRNRPEERKSELACPPTTGETDARTNGLIVAMGVFVAVAAAAIWPSTSYRWGAVALSLLAGFVIMPAVVGKVPGYRWWLAPLLAVAGGIVVSLCTRPVDGD
jgi:VanZ family protein